MSIYLPREVGNFAGLALFQSSGGLGWVGLAPLIFIFAIFYFLLIMPQQRRQKKWQQMLSQLKTGDKVVTSGGLRGTIIEAARRGTRGHSSPPSRGATARD